MMAAKASAQITLHYVIDIKATYRYYLLQSSTATKPSKPTTFPPSSSWDDAEPSYTEGSTKSLYYVDCTVFADDTFKYSEVSLSSSYEAAKQAYNKAVNAQNSANNAQDTANSAQEGVDNLHDSMNETIDNTKNDIMAEVGDQFATKDELQTSIEDITLTMEKDRSSMTLTFEGIQTTISEMNNQTVATFENWEKYIRFVDGNIVLGQEGNQITLQITNEKISFLQAGNEVAYFSNQKLYITDAEILHSLIIGNFAYIPRSNGSLDFKKVR